MSETEVTKETKKAAPRKRTTAKAKTAAPAPEAQKPEPSKLEKSFGDLNDGFGGAAPSRVAVVSTPGQIAPAQPAGQVHAAQPAAIAQSGQKVGADQLSKIPLPPAPGMPSAEQVFDARKQIGFKVSRVVLIQSMEIPMAGAETSLYAAKGQDMSYVPLDGVYGIYKGRRWFVPKDNMAGFWL